MRARTRRVWIAFGLMAVMLTSGCWYLYRAVPIGTGYAAKYLCSGVFIAKRDPKVVFESDIKPVNILTRIISSKIDHENRTATAQALGVFRSTAVYRNGCGCTLVVGTNMDNLIAQNIPDLTKNPVVEDLPWPIGAGGPESPLPVGIHKEGIQAALDRAFAEPTTDKRRQTRAVVVVYDGQLIAERYARGFDHNTRFIGWSMTKSIVNAMMGIMVRQERLDIKKPAPVPEWQAANDPRKLITIDQLLRMSSGLAFDETYEPIHDITDMLYREFDMAAFAADKKMEAEPDRIWHYSSGTANILSRVIQQATGGSIENSLIFLHEQLFQKIGMHSAVMELDPSGTMVGSSYAHATARDWARFGFLYLNDGVWQEQRILPQGWVAYTASPAPEAPQGKYGALFWLNGWPDMPTGRRPLPRLPADTFWADGYQGQRVFIVPSKRLVVVRLGLTLDASNLGVEDLVADIINALPDFDFSK